MKTTTPSAKLKFDFSNLFRIAATPQPPLSASHIPYADISPKWGKQTGRSDLFRRGNSYSQLSFVFEHFSSWTGGVRPEDSGWEVVELKHI